MVLEALRTSPFYSIEITRHLIADIESHTNHSCFYGISTGGEISEKGHKGGKKTVLADTAVESRQHSFHVHRDEITLFFYIMLQQPCRIPVFP